MGEAISIPFRFPVVIARTNNATPFRRGFLDTAKSSGRMAIPVRIGEGTSTSVSETTNPTTPHRLIIAIDGPAGAGKSTVAQSLAGLLGVPYLDTGAMYRCAGLIAREAGLIPPLSESDGERLAVLLRENELCFEATRRGLRAFINGRDVTNAIRTPEAGEMASAVSALSPVRRALVPLQRRMAQASGGVAEGRDIGSVVFPDADLKIFLTAHAEERARRRLNDLRARGVKATLEEVRRSQQERDLRDTSRLDSPLKVAHGAIVIDSTRMTQEEVVERILEELASRVPGVLDSIGADAVKSRNYGRLAHCQGAASGEEEF